MDSPTFPWTMTFLFRRNVSVTNKFLSLIKNPFLPQNQSNNKTNFKIRSKINIVLIHQNSRPNEHQYP